MESIPETPAHTSDTASARRWVVVHDSYRDHYELPIALAEAGLLDRFVTDWYTPMEHPLWQTVAKSRLGRSSLGLHNRYRPELPSSLTQDRKVGFVSSLLRRKLLKESFQDEVEGAKAGLLAAGIANKRGLPLFATSYSAAAAFAALRPDLCRVLFQVHPQPRSLQRLFQRAIAADPDYVGLQGEPETTVSEENLKLWERESDQADFVLCASQFSRRTLEESGFPSQYIGVVPYGVDSVRFQPGSPEPGATFKALYVGQKVARKSLRTLLRAWQELNPAGARLVIAGGHVRDPHMLEDFEGCYEEVPRTNLQDLIRLYQSADVFVLPSIAEGFGHVYLEALACGTPIVCTENTGGADIITEGESGWVVPAGDRAALRERLAWCIEHRAEVRAMRPAARAVAEKHTWERFRATVRGMLDNVTTRRP